MSDLLSLIRTFARVVETGSFTAVAREMNTSQPTVSRQVAQLEQHLGCLLLSRTTRALTLTEDGRLFHERARGALEALDDAESAVGRRRGQPTGVLRLACAVVLGRLHIIPRLSAFLDRYPRLDVELSMSDRFSDLVSEGIDLAVRVGEMDDAAYVGRRIGTTRRVVVAAREYVERHGEPRTPTDLASHSCIVYSELSAGANWTFVTPSGPLAMPVRGRVRVNNTEGVRSAILRGLGVGYVPVWHFVDGEIESGRLVVLLRDFEPRPQPIHAIYPSRRYLAPKVRAMVDYLALEFAADPRLNA